MEAKEMRALSVEELEKRARELRETLFNLKVQHRTGSLEKNHELGQQRKDLARILTVLSEKARSAAASKQA